MIMRTLDFYDILVRRAFMHEVSPSNSMRGYDVVEFAPNCLHIVAVTWTTPRLGPYQAPCTTPKLGPYQAPIIRRANWSGRTPSMLRVVYKM